MNKCIKMMQKVQKIRFYEQAHTQKNSFLNQKSYLAKHSYCIHSICTNSYVYFICVQIHIYYVYFEETSFYL